jgi:hypothetical protein
MPRLTQAVPRDRKHRATGQAVCTINSKDHFLGLHGSKASRAEYDRLIAEWLASGRSTAYGVPEHVISVVELIVAYLEYADVYYGDGPRTAAYEFTVRVRAMNDASGGAQSVLRGTRGLAEAFGVVLDVAHTLNIAYQQLQLTSRSASTWSNAAWTPWSARSTRPPT